MPVTSAKMDHDWVVAYAEYLWRIVEAGDPCLNTLRE